MGVTNVELGCDMTAFRFHPGFSYVIQEIYEGFLAIIQADSSYILR